MVEDPLRNLPEQERLLFEQLTLLCNGRNLDTVLGAAVNLIQNAIRQTYATRSEAESKFDELFGLTKQRLLHNHYDSVTGRRRAIFPFTQVVRMDRFEERE